MNPAALLTRAFEAAGIRGAPTILKHFSKFAYFRDQVATVRLPSGVEISFPAYDEYWARYLYAGAPYESDVEALFRTLGKGRILIDCGANIGYWSARHKEFGFTRAIAIEANPKLIPFLRRNHPGELHHAAVYSSSGATLCFDRNSDGAKGKLALEGIPVPSLALADLDIGEPALVKLDVEGSESAAIRGARDMDAIFIFEDWSQHDWKVTDFALKEGFHVYGMGNGLEAVGSLAEAGKFKVHAKGPVNLVASRRPLPG